MNDPNEKDPKAKPIDTLEDDAIIELVDEVEDEPISPLERQLLGLRGGTPTLARNADMPDLGGIRFDEEDDTASLPVGDATAARGGSISLQDAERLIDDTSPAVPPKSSATASNDIEEISEFEEQYLDPEEVLDLKPQTAATPEDEPIELIDSEEEELDDELLWFDDLKTGDEPPAEIPTGLPEHEEIELILPEDAELGPTSAADVFAAHLESLFPESGVAPGREAEEGIPLILPEDDVPAPAPVPEPTVVSAAAAAAANGIVIPELPGPSPVPETPPPASPALIPPEEIEAAIERVIERKLGGTIESTILRVIETAVTREIERLKQLLLEDDNS